MWGVRRGLDIAVDEINKAGGVNGRQLQIVLLDGESDPAKAVMHTKRLIEVDKVVGARWLFSHVIDYGSHADRRRRENTAHCLFTN